MGFAAEVKPFVAELKAREAIQIQKMINRTLSLLRIGDNTLYEHR